MKKLQLALGAILVVCPVMANASLIQDVYIVGDTEDTFIGTFTFPNERQVPNPQGLVDYLGGPATCDFPNTDVPELDPCSPLSFAPDFDSFPPLGDLDGTGIGIPEPSTLFGGWVIEDGTLTGIFAWLYFGFTDPATQAQRWLTLVFAGNRACGTVEDRTLGLVECFQTYPDDILTVRYEPVGVPEPGSLALLGVGLVGIGVARRKKK